MEVWGLMVGVTAPGELAATCAAAATVGGGLVGLIFRGAAAAWREERDAAVGKADRLEIKVDEQAGQIQELQQKVVDLQKRTDYDAYAERSAERSGREHREIVQTLGEFKRSLDANTTAVEFLLKQVFPTVAIIPPAERPADAA